MYMYVSQAQEQPQNHDRLRPKSTTLTHPIGSPNLHVIAMTNIPNPQNPTSLLPHPTRGRLKPQPTVPALRLRSMRHRILRILPTRS
jgi:hypothetical protein